MIEIMALNNWNDDRDHGVKQREYLYPHFQLPLDHKGFVCLFVC